MYGCIAETAKDAERDRYRQRKRKKSSFFFAFTSIVTCFFLCALCVFAVQTSSKMNQSVKTFMTNPAMMGIVKLSSIGQGSHSTKVATSAPTSAA